MSTHNKCFCGEVRKILCGYPPLICSYACSNFRTSMVRSYGVPVFRVNAVIVILDRYFFNQRQIPSDCVSSDRSGQVLFAHLIS